MREWLARGIVLLTFAMIVGLAVVFAWRHNSQPRPAVVKPLAADTASAAGSSFTGVAAQGSAIFRARGCATCHSIGDEGNPRYPLDGVGRRRSAAELRAWILGEGPAATELPASTQRRKQRYREIPETELAALVAYLATLRSAGRQNVP